jgi:hypothetical protein
VKSPSIFWRTLPDRSEDGKLSERRTRHPDSDKPWGIGRFRSTRRARAMWPTLRPGAVVPVFSRSPERQTKRPRQIFSCGRTGQGPGTARPFVAGPEGV